MGKKYTKAQATAHKKYMENKTTIRVVLSKEKAVEYKNAASAAGKSISKFVVDCIESNL